MPLLLVNNQNQNLVHHDDATRLFNKCKTWLRILTVQIQEILERLYGGLQAPAHWLPWNSTLILSIPHLHNRPGLARVPA
jgi:hypothetical protein